MRLLIDENVPHDVAVFLRNRGHDVDLVSERLGQMTPDEFIAWVGDELGAVVVTFDRDFKRLASRAPRGMRQRFRQLGRISFRCRESEALRRIRTFIEEIEREYDICRASSDRRLIVEITGTTFVITR